MKTIQLTFLALVFQAVLVNGADLTRHIWSGAVTKDSGRIKAGMRQDHAEVRVMLSTRADFSDPILSAPQAASTGVVDGVVDFTVAGLEPITAYYYRIVTPDAVDDRIGRFTTFTDEPFSFHFAVSACAAQGSTDPVFLAIRDEEPLFFMNTGDLHYLNIAVNDVAVFYDGYRQVLSSHTQRALYESTSFIYMWDDHDYGPNNSDKTSPSRTASRLAYRDYIPHYPLPAGPGDAPIQQSFNVGRVKFIMTDLRSEKDPPSMAPGPNKRTMSLAQQEWFFNELLDGRDNYAATIWISSYPWIGGGTSSSDFWNGYTHHRDEVAAFIKDNNIHNLSMIAGDAHMLAIDDGTNNRYPDDTPGFPVFQAAALTSSGSVKGGPYTSGTFPGNGQYGLVRVEDTGGDTVRIFWEGKHRSGTTLIQHEFTTDASHLVPDHAAVGRITENGQGLGGVTIAAGTRSTTSDSSGHYRLPLPPGEHSIHASRAGYTFSPGAHEVSMAESDIGPLDFAATNLGWLTATYLSGPGGTIEGAAEQAVPAGTTTAPVTAVPAHGFAFLRWTDGLTFPQRSDLLQDQNKRVMALFSTVPEARSTLLHYVFDQPAGRTLAQITPVVGNSNWVGPAISNLATDGNGQLINTGNSGTGSNNLAFGRPLDNSQRYELTLGTVTFQNLAGSHDFVAVTLRTTITGTQAGGSSRDHYWLRIGNLGGQSNAIDARFGRNSADTANERLDIAPLGTYDVIIQYDIPGGSAEFLLVSDTETIRIGGVTSGSQTAVLEHIGYGHVVTAANSQERIGVGSLRFESVTTVDAAPNSYEEWAGLNGIHGEPPDGDFDGDGVPNLMEYALAGMDPAVPEASPLTLVDGVKNLFKRPEAAANPKLRFTLQRSSDLGITDPWHAIAPDFEDASQLRFNILANPGGFYRVTISILP